MLKKVLWGCSALVVLVVIAIAVVLKLGSGEATATHSDKHILSQDLEREFGGQPQVAFVCRFPAVGIAPCVLDSDIGTREVVLTFTNYELPDDIAPEEWARRIAILAFETSAFAEGSDRTDVIFEDMQGSDSAIVTRKYSFPAEALAVGRVALPETGDEAANE